MQTLSIVARCSIRSANFDLVGYLAEALLKAQRYLPSNRHRSVLVASGTKRAAIQVVEGSDIMLIEPMHDAAAHALLCRMLIKTKSG
jgi:hypothetical protein